MSDPIRPALLTDAPALLALTIELGYASDLMELQERLARLLGMPEHALLVAEDGGRVVGFLHARVDHQIESPSYVEIAGLIVGDGHRGRGFGARLVGAADAWAQARGVRELRVRCNVKRPRTHAFYRRLGFAEIKEQKNFARRLGA